jgi:fumarate reductase flavoprotein subunit
MGIIFPEGYVRSVEHHAPISKECDVVVIGGGAAGLIAAAKTAEEGKKVILLEKLPKLGGGSQYAQGLKLFGTKIEKEAGIPDQMDDYIRSALNTCRWELNPRLIANAFHALPQCFDWMCEWANMDSWALGPTPFGTMAVEPKTHHDAGRFITENMERRCRENGVEILTETAAKKLVVENGTVTGVVAEDAGGQIVISAKACVMSTGNISYGEVLKRTVPEYYYADTYPSCHRLPSNTGDHITMAEDAGITVDYDSIAAAYLGGMMCLNVDFAVMPQGNRGETLKINKKGQRWINESVNGESAIWALLRQPQATAYVILDDAVLNSPMEPPYLPVVNRTGRNIAEGIPGPDGKFAREVHIGPPGGHGMPPELMKMTPAEAIRHSAQLKGGHTFVADTPEELAQKMGVPADTFVATLNRYNDLCDKGHDDDFYKLPNYMKPLRTGPYYAIKIHMATDGVFGGLDADEKGRVLSDGTPVSGLYCAGDTIGNRYINQGGEKLECINDFAWAFASGYLAAKSILEEL